MPLRPNLMREIQSVFSSTLPPSLNSLSDASDLYEAYLFSLVCRAARTEGATIAFRSINNPNPSQFVFRTSPGYISSTNKDYGYAILSFPNKPTLEAHVGVRVTGSSQVLHECDVSVLLKEEADLCRNNLQRVAPRATSLIISIEAKFYSGSLGLGLGRGFLGFTMDVRADKAYFVTNLLTDSIGKLLSHKKRYWEQNIQPQNATDVNRLVNAFQTAFKDFKASY